MFVLRGQGFKGGQYCTGLSQLWFNSGCNIIMVVYICRVYFVGEYKF